MNCGMAAGISFDVSLSLNCTDLNKRRLYAPPSLVIHRNWLLHHRKVTRYSCNLNTGMEHKHTGRPRSDSADPNQTAPSNQGLHDKLFCRLKQTQKKIW